MGKGNVQAVGATGRGEFVSICNRIQTYQYPLQEHGRKTRCWGEVDLLGIGPDFLPVPCELKKREAHESPLRMLVEVAAYGFAVRKVWPNLKEEWAKSTHWLGHCTTAPPATLDSLTLIGVAPDEYWCRCLGLLSTTKKGAFPAAAWRPFWHLVDALGKWFNIHFVALEGRWDDDVRGGSPTIIGARILNLRSLTPDPSSDAYRKELARAGRDALLQAYQRTLHRQQFSKSIQQSERL